MLGRFLMKFFEVAMILYNVVGAHFHAFPVKQGRRDMLDRRKRKDPLAAPLDLRSPRRKAERRVKILRMAGKPLSSGREADALIAIRGRDRLSSDDEVEAGRDASLTLAVLMLAFCMAVAIVSVVSLILIYFPIGG